VRSTRMLSRSTMTAESLRQRVLVVGDVVGYSAISQTTSGAVLVEAMGSLFDEFRGLLRTQRGTLADVPGDAFFAYWDPNPGGVEVAHALDFALLADKAVREKAPGLSLRNADGTPIAMGWAVVIGEVAISPLGASVLGDATNLAFRLSGIAARGGREPVLVTEPVRDAVGDDFVFDSGEDVAVKGRLGSQTVYGARRSELGPRA
jgi:adenylate cyclase